MHDDAKMYRVALLKTWVAHMLRKPPYHGMAGMKKSGPANFFFAEERF
jgi:hypothetical protein